MNFEPLQVELLSFGDTLRSRGLRVATAESCTGGLIAAACTSVAGSSDWFDRGFVSYSNEAKAELLGVDAALVAAHGAVSEEVVLAMANGGLKYSHADLVVAVTGIAGPGGAVPGKPVGLVWLALGARGAAPVAQRFEFAGDRTAVREATLRAALTGLAALAARTAALQTTTPPTTPPLWP